MKIKSMEIAVCLSLIVLATEASAQTHPYSAGDLLPSCDFGVSTCAGSGTHRGVDLMGSQGDEIKAMCDGVIIHDTTSRPNVWDAFLVIEHDCNGETVYGYYGHLSSSVSGNVVEGQVIGTLREYATNNEHLHFGVSTQRHNSGWGYGDVSDFIDPDVALAGAMTESGVWAI